MASTAPPDRPARLALTKLVVEDLDAAAHFYATVFGWRTFRRTEPGRPVFGKEEIAMSADGRPGAGALILMKFASRPCPPPGCCFLGFLVDDAAAAVRAARALDARVLMDVEERAGAPRFGLFRDPAGHMVEVIEDAQR